MSSSQISIFIVLSVFVFGVVTRAEQTNNPTLKEIVVIGTRTEKDVKDVPATVQVIAPSVVKVQNPATIDELFGRVVGVDLQGSGFPGSFVRLNMRGLSDGYQTERVLVLQDGRRLNDQYQGNVEFSMVPADGVERVEVLRGPASALYGYNAMAGVVNIISKTGTVTPTGRLSAEFGNHETYHYSAEQGWKIGPFDYFIAGSYIETDGYMLNTDGTKRDWQAGNIVGNFGLETGPNSELRFFTGFYHGEGTDENSQRDTAKDYQSGVYTWRMAREGEKLQIRLYRNGMHDDYDWKFGAESIYRQETLGSDIQQSLWMGNFQLVTAGFENRYESVDADEIGSQLNEHVSIVSLFAQDEIYLGDSWVVTAGLRFDENKDFGGEYSPRAGLLWKAFENTELFGSYNRASRAPSLSDRFVKAQYNGFQFEGNPDLVPETMDAWEIGARQKLCSKLTGEVSVFIDDLKDAFDFVLDPDGVFRNRNITRIRTHGVEAGLRYSIIRQLSAFANYSYTDGEYRGDQQGTDGNTVAYLAENKASCGLDFMTSKGQSHSLTVRYIGPRYGDAQNTEENKMDEYITVDWRSRVPMCSHSALTLKVNNIFDQTYQELPNVDQPGRIFMVGVEATF